MPELVVLVGLPASGKSTVAKEYGDRGYVVVSSDAIRAELWGDESIHGDPAKVFGLVQARCRLALLEGRDVVMDATNMNAKKRKGFLRQMPECRKICVVMATPFNECVTRDEERSRNVGIAVMKKMLCAFEMPHRTEGWDRIDIRYCDSPYYIGSEHFSAEKEFDQHNHHHTKTVGEHEIASAKYAEEQGWHTIVLACAWHDCGKLHTQSFDEEGEAHYYGHNNASAYYYLTSEFAKHAVEREGDIDSVIETASLITWHMVPYQFKREADPQEAAKKWCKQKGFDELFAKDLWHLHLADVWAH